MKNRVIAGFRSAFGKQPEMLIAAPGRVNLIGEHTDYNDGFVLPCAIDYETIVAISPTQSEQVTAIASDYGNARDRFIPSRTYAAQPEEWKNHLRGIAASFGANGHRISGANIAIAGNIPQGAGLSSSASLGVGLAKAFREANTLQQIDETQLALLAQQSENDFVGCACGVMDQLASARSKAGHAMLLDCRSLQIKHVVIPDDLAILIVHSGIERELINSAYNERREQCERAARHYGVDALRDLDIGRLVADKGKLDDLTFRRARHVVSENIRTTDAATALESGNAELLGQLMAESHASMRDDFEITLPAIDRLVETISGEVAGTVGARMTGGGFGGCVVALLHRDSIENSVSTLEGKYIDPNGKPPKIHLATPAAGVAVLV